MNGIANALEQLRTEIRQIQDYLAQLQETEQQLAKLDTARRMVLGTVSPVESFPIAEERPQEPSGELLTAPDKRPLPFDIINLLGTAGRAMGLVELQRELNKIREPVQKNALSSTLTRLVQEHRIKRPKPGHYAAIGPADRTEEAATLRRDSMPSVAYAILREAGRPLTTDEIWISVRDRKPNASKQSLIGSLYYNSKIGRIFTHIDEKTFGLREWQNRQIENHRMSGASETPRPIEASVSHEVQVGALESKKNPPNGKGQSLRAQTLEILAAREQGMTANEVATELLKAGRETTPRKVASLLYRFITEDRVDKLGSGKFAVRKQLDERIETSNDKGLADETRMDHYIREDDDKVNILQQNAPSDNTDGAF